MKVISNNETILVNGTQIIHNVDTVEYGVFENVNSEIIPFSQRDPLWSNDVMQNKTIGQVGCAITCCAMLASQFDDSITPKIFNEFLKSNQGYANYNLILWAKLNELVPQIKFVGYEKWTNTPANTERIQDVIAKRPTILRVDFRPGGALDSHFVLALSMQDNDVSIIDPWDGAHTKLLQRYALNDWNLARAIYAMVVYEW